MAKSAINQLLIATSNRGKVTEIETILARAGEQLELLSLLDLPNQVVPPEETGLTFADNALLKAKYYGELSQLPTVADDSGLSVLELDGFPGVNSARWIDGSDQDRVAGLLQLMADNQLTEPLQRRAYFSCVAALYHPANQQLQTFEGICWGTLAHVPVGSTGFGYDPIFIPDGHDQTMAQLGPEIKNKISHRAKAFNYFAEWLRVSS